MSEPRRRPRLHEDEWTLDAAWLGAAHFDLGAERVSVSALLLAMAWPRLAPLGLVTREMADRIRCPGEDLDLSAYRLLSQTLGNAAHARFLALLAELDSGVTALEREHRHHLEQAVSP